MNTPSATSPPTSGGGGAAAVGGFRGFADFAAGNDYRSTTAAATLAAARAGRQKKGREAGGRGDRPDGSGGGREKAAGGGTGSAPATALRPSPVFTGSDRRLSVLFRRIGQKRDPTTKARALAELSRGVYGAKGVGADAEDGTASLPPSESDEPFSRPERVASLLHLAYLLETRLGHDNSPAVRAAAFRAAADAREAAPKAWRSLFGCGEDVVGGSGGGSNVEGGRPCAGLAWCLASGDPAADARGEAARFVRMLDERDDDTDSKSSPPSSPSAPSASVRAAVLSHCGAMLGCRRASALHDLLNPTVASISSSGGDDGGGDKKKGKQQRQQQAESSDGGSGNSAEETEERYERTVLASLAGLDSLLRCSPEVDGEDGRAGGKTSADYSADFPPGDTVVRLARSTTSPSFRRGAYGLLGTVCQFAPSLVLPPASECGGSETGGSEGEGGGEKAAAAIPMAGLVPSLISAERDPNNVPSLLEAALTYLAAFKKRSAGSAWDEMDAAQFARSLSKTLRRACHGADPGRWGPMILPLAASLPQTWEGMQGTSTPLELQGEPLSPILICPAGISNV